MKNRRPRPLLWISVFGSTAALGCTFGGLASYDIESCDPAAQSQSADACDRLNSDPTTCTPYQCDTATSRCLQKPRDDDRDGDSPAQCGGSDCDDADQRRSSKAAEQCDEADNDCDEVIDEDVVTAGTSRLIAMTGELEDHADPTLSPMANGFLATLGDSSAQGSCLSLIPLSHSSTGPLATGCALLDDELTLAPRQAFTTPVRGGFGAAFVATSGCASGYLSYVFQAASARRQSLACDPLHPAALPSIALLPTSGSLAPGMFAWYEAPVLDRDDPLANCEDAAAAPLSIAFLPDLSNPAALDGRARELAPVTTSLRPAALLASAEPAGIFVASPVADDVGVWFLTSQDLMPGSTLPKPTRLAGLSGARSTAIAFANVDDTTHVAVAAEIGCVPSQSLALALGTLLDGEFSFEATIEIETDAPLLTQPSIAWVDARGGEWWVSWIDDRPGARLQRYSLDGTAIGGAVDLGDNVLLGGVSASDGAAYYGFDSVKSGGAFVEIPVGCN